MESNLRFSSTILSYSPINTVSPVLGTFRKSTFYLCIVGAILILLLQTPFASGIETGAATLQSGSISGTGTTKFESKDDYVMWRGDALEDFLVEGESVKVSLYHASYFTADPLIGIYDDYHNETQRYEGENQLSLTRTDPKTEITITPTTGHSTTILNQGKFFGYPVDEESIMWDKDSHGEGTPNSYEVVVESTNGFEFREGTETTIEGSFLIYVWEADLRHVHDEGVSSYETGYKQTPTGSDSAVSSSEYTYAKITVTNGMIRTGGHPEKAAINLYSQEVVVNNDDSVTYEQASGTIPTLDGMYNVSAGGEAVVEGGVAAWTTGEDTIEVAFLEPTTKISGAEIVEEQPPASGSTSGQSSGTLIPLIGAGILVALVAGAYVTPNIVAKDEGPDASWRQKRARGYLVLARRAKENNHLHLASSMLCLSKRNNRKDPACRLLIATIHSDRGAHERALKARRRVHHLLTAEGLPDPDEVADNAYQAARIAAALEMKGRALHWLKIAISYNPDLADEARWEVDFDLISLEPEYKVLMGERMDLGWNPPSA